MMRLTLLKMMRSTVRNLLRIVSAKKWEAHQMDVHNAFLHGDLEEEVYMKLPAGFRHTDPNKVCRLHKSIYGLKQASRCWFAKLTSALTKFGFIQSYADYSLFTFTREGVELRVLIYVDDFLICGNHTKMLESFKAYLGRCFHMKDLGKAKYFLGVEIARSPEDIYLSQRKYVLDIANEVGLLGSQPAPTPIEQVVFFLNRRCIDVWLDVLFTYSRLNQNCVIPYMFCHSL